jgi:CubicO group peptidase (beta-lactamase class C family)
VYKATGHYGQVIYVVPEVHMVVVFTGNIPDEQPYPHNALLLRYILPACTDLSPDALKRSYAAYGWTAQYPLGMRVDERPLTGEEAVSAASGMVNFYAVAYPLELYAVLWRQQEQEDDLEGYLDSVLGELAAQQDVELRREPLRQGHKGTHRMLAQSCEIWQGGKRVWACEIAAWYCGESGRAYAVTYLLEPGMPGPEPAAALQQFLDSLACHGQSSRQ